MIKRINMLGALLMGMFLGYAQDARLLTLSDAITYALQSKSDATKAVLDIRKGDAKIAEVKASAFPELKIVSNTSYSPLLQKTVLPGEIFGLPGQSIEVAFGQKWTSTASAQLTQVLFNQSVFTGLKAAKSTKEFYILNKQLTDEQIIDKVATTYYQVYKSEQMLSNLDSNLDITQKTVTIIKGLYDAGLAKKIDYDRSVVALNNLKANKQQLINSRQISENTLKYIIGMPMDQEIVLPEDTFEPRILPEYDSNYHNTLDNRTELKVLNKQLELLNWQKKASIAEYYPSVTLTANYGWLGQGEKIPWWHGKNDNVYWSDMSTIGLNINIPVFNGFSTRSKIQQNQIDIEKAQADLEDSKLALDMAYKNSVSQLKNSQLAIDNQQDNVKLAQEVMENTQNNYKFGLATLNDILDAERDLSDAKNNLTTSRLDYKLAEIEYLKSQGKLKTLNGNN